MEINLQGHIFAKFIVFYEKEMREGGATHIFKNFKIFLNSGRIGYIYMQVKSAKNSVEQIKY